MIINSYYVLPPYDPNAQAFITATGLSGISATSINDLVLDLKAATLWTGFTAVYPFAGGSSTTQKFNLLNPLDTNAAYRLSFQGGWTHSASGATPNGTNAYAITYITPSAITENSSHLTYYSRSNTLGTIIDAGIFGSGANTYNLLIRYTGGGFEGLFSDVYNYNTNRINVTTNLDSRGFYQITRTDSTTHKAYKNGFQTGSTNTNASSGFVSLTGNLTLGARNDLPAGTYSNRQCAFASSGKGFDDGQSQLYYQIVEKYQVALSRNINPIQSFYYNRNLNNNTNRFLFSTQITDSTIQTAMNSFVETLKGYNIWNKMKALYPLVGGTATTHKYNLVNPLDTNAAYRLSFFGGWTHDSSGMTPTITSYASTFLIPNTALTLRNTHLAIYMLTDSAAGTKTEIGSANAGTANPSMGLFAKYSSTNAVSDAYNNTTNRLSVSNSDAKGFYIGSRTSINSHKLYKNGVLIGTDTNNEANGAMPNVELIIGAFLFGASVVQGTDRKFALISIGDGLTDTEAANYYTAVQALQTALGRQV